MFEFEVVAVAGGWKDWSSLGRLVGRPLRWDDAAFWRAWEADMVGRRSGWGCEYVVVDVYVSTNERMRWRNWICLIHPWLGRDSRGTGGG